MNLKTHYLLPCIAFIFLVGVFDMLYNGNDEKPLDIENPAFDLILKDWAKMHNDGSETHIEQFIHQYYHPDLIKKITLKDHITFYKTVIDDFGQIDPDPLEIVTKEDTKWVVHYLKKGIKRELVEIPPEQILEVEIDVVEGQTHLSRGLGLGALVCKLKK